MNFREELSENSPPEWAGEMTGTTVRYRLLTGDQPKEADFDSLAKMNGAHIQGARYTECEQHGLSLWAEEEQARRILNSRINRRGRRSAIGRLTIPPGQGKLNPMARTGHQTWWPNQEFDPVSNCRRTP